MGDFALPINSNSMTKNKRWGQGDDQIVVFGNTSRANAVKQLQRLMDQSSKKFDYERAMEFKEQIRKLRG